jgi:tetratricopeptide (TPR) repeat protein
MSRADSIMESNQDSATAALRILDGAKSLLPEFSKRQRMRYQLLYAKAMNKGYVNFTSDSTMKVVTKYYDRHGTANEKMLAHYLLGCTYRDLNDVPMELQCFQDAIECADTTKNGCDYHTLSRICSQISLIYQKYWLVQENFKTLDLMQKYALKDRDTLTYVAAIESRMHAFYAVNEYDSVIIYCQKASKILRKLGYNQRADIDLSGSALAYMFKGDYNSADKMLKIYEMSLHKMKNINGYEVFFYNKGKYYLDINSLDSAEYCFRKEYKIAKDYNNKIASTRGLSLLFQKKNKPDSTAKYAMLSYALNDSAYNQNLAKNLQLMTARYNYERNKKIAAINKNRAETYKLTAIVIFVVLLFVISVFIFSFFIFRQRRKNKYLMLKNQYEYDIIELEKEKNSLNSLLSQKEKKFGQKEIRFNNEIIAKEKKIRLLNEQIDKAKISLRIDDESQFLQYLSTKTIYSLFKAYNKNVRLNPSTKEWEELFMFVDGILPDFRIFLLDRHGINTTDYKICVLLVLRFKLSEIRRLTGLSTSALSNERSRLLKNVYGVDGRPKDFDDRIMLLSKEANCL